MSGSGRKISGEEKASEHKATAAPSRHVPIVVHPFPDDFKEHPYETQLTKLNRKLKELKEFKKQPNARALPFYWYFCMFIEKISDAIHTADESLNLNKENLESEKDNLAKSLEAAFEVIVATEALLKIKDLHASENPSKVQNVFEAADKLFHQLEHLSGKANVTKDVMGRILRRVGSDALVCACLVMVSLAVFGMPIAAPIFIAAGVSLVIAIGGNYMHAQGVEKNTRSNLRALSTFAHDTSKKIEADVRPEPLIRTHPR